jgi:hypothetical protein
MPFVFDRLVLQNPAEILFVALAATVAGVVILVVFILTRRALRRRYFARRDRRSQYIRHNWRKILEGKIQVEQWFFNPLDHSIVEGIVLDQMDVADFRELGRLQEFVRASGLLDKRIHEVRHNRAWRRRQALSALGRMRVSESVAALTEALQDSNDVVVVDAIHGLGLVGTPRAGAAILQWISGQPAQCPPQILQNALLNCYQAHASSLLGRVLESDDTIRPILARVLAEIAGARMSGDVLTLAADPLAEVRASAARVLALVRPHYALHALARLAGDDEWFVRLRAVVAIGDLGERRGVPLLILALCDSNRFVRLRAAASLVRFRGEEERILQLAMQTGDHYALQALVSEMERSGRIPELVNTLEDATRRPAIESALLTALRGGSMHILNDLLLSHPSRRVRTRLARLLAGSGEPTLLQQLEEVELALATRQQKRVLRWIIARLRETIECAQALDTAVAV